jgi:hypothetical protein
MGRPKKDGNWDDHYYVASYRLALSGLVDTKIARSLGVKDDTFARWVKQRPALADALQQARNRGATSRAFMEQMTERMPADLQEVWRKLSSDDPVVREDGQYSLQKAGRRKQQHLFINAWVAMNFNQDRACQATGTRMATFHLWRRQDKEFKKLMDFVREARGDFYENALIEKVAQGDTTAVIFANRTYNKDRGYDSKVTVEVGGSVEQRHTITVKELSTEAKRQLLEEIRRKKELAQLEDNSKVIDAEFSVNGEVHDESD